ncbi:hypothetical protein E4U42_007265 [Claviceps africana]|uniref:Uncharacterized protein n=1 Tax=Claviceps africana TaxID=83212 RepID=A0A8K0J1B0_9HYPO|nr:hypothetical protein E4U42_007265 [Claviceps africana]
MFSLRNLVFLAVAVTGSVIPRDVGQVKKDLETLNSDTQAVTNAVNGFDGSMQSSTPIIVANNRLNIDIGTTTGHVNSVGKVSEADADEIIRYITGKFQPSVDGALSALKAKKDKFQAIGLVGIVRASLEKLKGNAEGLSGALITNAPASRVEMAKAIKAHIDAGIDDAIKQFS